MIRRKWVSVGLAVGALIVALYPIETVTVPEWNIHYVDPAGQPVSGLKLRQTWQNESVESSPHSALAFTDEDGSVVFPERTVRAPLILRLIGPVRNVLETGAHASFGPSSWVVPLCDVTEQGGGAVYEGADLTRQVTIAKSDASRTRESLGFADDPDCSAIHQRLSSPPVPALVSAPAGC